MDFTVKFNLLACTASILFGIFGKALSLTCMQCKNYNTFFISPQLNTLDCTNSSNWIEVTCDPGSRFCLKLQGAIYSSPGSTPQPNTADGIQRGCSPPEGTNASRIFLADGNAYRQDGSCQTGQFKNISVPYNQLFNTNLQPIYLFSGVYCLCSGDRCNEGSSLFAPSALVISSFFFVLLSVAGQK